MIDLRDILRLPSAANSFGHYVLGGGRTYTEDDLDKVALPYYQEMAQRSYGKAPQIQGQILHADYNSSEVLPEKLNPVRWAIGRTAPQGITKEGDYWRIRDIYNYPATNIDAAKKYLNNGQIMPAIASIMSEMPFGKDYKVDIKIPLDDQQKEYYSKPIEERVSPEFLKDNFTYGGQQYEWTSKTVPNNASISHFARQAVEQSSYAPEGTNLAKIQEAIVLKNSGSAGRPGDNVLVPVPVNQSNSQTNPQTNSQTKQSSNIIKDVVDDAIGVSGGKREMATLLNQGVKDFKYYTDSFLKKVQDSN